MHSSQTILYREPSLADGMSVFRLIEGFPPLDTNSSYCNLLQYGYFSSTSVAAEHEGELVGFISGYWVPERPGTLFIWQVAVDESARWPGLASQMLLHILNRPACYGIHHLETTITEDNKPSWALFESLAERLDAEVQSSIWLDKQTHFDGQHLYKSLVRIGPFNPNETRDNHENI